MPWSAIAQSQDDFVTRKYVPVDVDLKEPSKLQHLDTMALLNFWYARQETGKGPTFLFKAWKNKDGDMVALVISGNSPSQQTCKVRKQMTQMPQNSLTKTESDLKSNSHHMEDGNVEEDVAMEGENTSPALKNMQGKKAVIVPSARTTRSKSKQQPSDSTPQVTRARGKK
ncbi:hypothetical protein EV702DRAFT_1202248 [Suillus placidus]|uniref:Uncharacterized protein n=1 Tax=Suillus placidus TaxID=48579 RepID=A0A9P7CZ38_9AGAM|nr:hypothetical protein EV702DRAFT_1202248 [Suillus placidus]